MSLKTFERLFLFGLSVAWLSSFFYIGDSNSDWLKNFIKPIFMALGTTTFATLVVDLLTKGRFIRKIASVFQPKFIEFKTGEEANQKINDSFLNANKIRCMGISFAYGREKFSIGMFVKKLLTEDCDIQIMIADKDSPMLGYLGEGNDVDIDKLRQDIQATIDFFNNLKEKMSDDKNIKGHFKLFTHCEIPHRGYSLYDNQCFITPYFYNKNAANGPVLNVTNKQSALYSEYQNYYRHCRSKGNIEVSIGRFS